MGNPIRQMAHEHESAGEALVTGGYTLPDDACPTFRAPYEEMQRMEEYLHQHIHLENNFLLPRAIAGESAVPFHLNKRRWNTNMATGIVWTVGHSNRSLVELIHLLASESIAMLADVRRFPGSKRQPQFAKDSLESSLRKAGIGYQHFEALGGRRSRIREDSSNTAWRSESFKAYADHMQTAEFQAALTDLTSLAASSKTAILCAEAVPWRCHRQLIADALVAHGWEVRHVLGMGRIQPHRLTEFARVVEGHVTYPVGQVSD